MCKAIFYSATKVGLYRNFNIIKRMYLEKEWKKNPEVYKKCVLIVCSFICIFN